MTHANPALAFQRRTLAKMKAEKEQREAAANEEAEQASERQVAAVTGPAKRVPNAALAHQQRVRQGIASERLSNLRREQKEKLEAAATEANDGFQMVLKQLDADEKRLRELPRGKARDELLKADLLPQWRPVVEAYLDGGEEYPNPVLVLVMIWSFNVNDLAFAMRCATVAIAQDQRMPERFKRDVPTFVADTVLEWAQNQALRGESYEPHFGQVAAQIDDWAAIPDEVRMKYLKFRAEQLASSDPRQALALYRQAFDIDPKGSKCKTAMEKLEKAVAKLDEAGAPSPANQTSTLPHRRGPARRRCAGR